MSSNRARLEHLLEKNGLNQMRASRATGLSQTLISQMLLGKRAITDKTLVRFLTAIEGKSSAEAQAQIALWKIQDARRQLQASPTHALAQPVMPYGGLSSRYIDALEEAKVNEIIQAISQQHPSVLGSISREELSLGEKRRIIKAYYRV